MLTVERELAPRTDRRPIRVLRREVGTLRVRTPVDRSMRLDDRNATACKRVGPRASGFMNCALDEDVPVEAHHTRRLGDQTLREVRIAGLDAMDEAIDAPQEPCAPDAKHLVGDEA